MIRLNPIPTRWVTHKLEKTTPKHSPTVVKVLSPTAGCLDWGVGQKDSSSSPWSWGHWQQQSWEMSLVLGDEPSPLGDFH